MTPIIHIRRKDWRNPLLIKSPSWVKVLAVGLVASLIYLRCSHAYGQVKADTAKQSYVPQKEAVFIVPYIDIYFKIDSMKRIFAFYLGKDMLVKDRDNLVTLFNEIGDRLYQRGKIDSIEVKSPKK